MLLGPRRNFFVPSQHWNINSNPCNLCKLYIDRYVCQLFEPRTRLGSVHVNVTGSCGAIWGQPCSQRATFWPFVFADAFPYIRRNRTFSTIIAFQSSKLRNWQYASHSSTVLILPTTTLALPKNKLITHRNSCPRHCSLFLGCCPCQNCAGVYCIHVARPESRAA